MKKNILIITVMAILFSGCSGINIIPVDNKDYSSVEKENYNYTKYRFETNSGTKVEGIHIKAEKSKDTMIVLTNGIIHNMSRRIKEWLWIVDEGYDVFTFDFRGYGESDVEPTFKGFKEDTITALEYAHKSFPNKKIILVGQSMGGTYVINTMSSKNKEKFKDYVSLMVADSTFVSFKNELADFMLKSVILSPISLVLYGMDDYMHSKLDSINNVEGVTVPTLFITGDNDWIVDPDYSEELYNKSLSSKKGLWIVRDKAHVKSFDSLGVRKYFLKLIEEKEKFKTVPKEITFLK